MSFVRSWCAAVVGGAADLVWPPVCPVCDEAIEDPVSDRGLHRACFGRLGARRELPLAFAVGAAPVHALLADRPEWFGVLHRVKYGGEFGLLDPFVGALIDALRDGGSVDGNCVFVPVPDDPVRRRTRGGSVVAALAERLAAGTGARVRHDLVRRRGTRSSQTEQPDDAARERNVDGAFAVGRLAELPARTRLVLVDDQATSGATLTELLRVVGVRGHACAVVVVARARRTPDLLRP